MKTYLSKYLLAGIGLTALVSCSTQKDRFINRNFHSVTTKYNILYNGNLALESGKQELANGYFDNYWDLLPIERMQVIEPVFGQDSVPRNTNFRRAEDKAVKAIDKHSMAIGGAERNPQMDEAYLLLAKARYYDQRFIPALEALNFILYKYPDSDKVNELKLWKEKVNIRLENNVLAIQNLTSLLSEPTLDVLIRAEAEAMLAQAYINENEQNQAIPHLQQAISLVKSNEEKARYTFILGQLFAKNNNNEAAYTTFQQVIDLKRKSPRAYVIQSHIAQAKLQEVTFADTTAFKSKYNKLLEDRENRPFLDALNHQVALFYETLNNDKKAIEYYNQSLRKKTKDSYTTASNYRNLGEIYFHSAKYSLAGKYYDSTLVNLDNKSREYRNIRRKRENLNDVIKYEAIATTNDSILKLVNMSSEERNTFFENYITKLKEEDRKLTEALAKGGGTADYGQQTEARKGMTGGVLPEEEMPSKMSMMRQDVSGNMAPKGSPGMPPTEPIGSNFYFYNQALVNQGKTDFRRRWGNRSLKDYWRLANYSDKANSFDEPELTEEGELIASKQQKEEPRFTKAFYLTQIPTNQILIDSIQKERNFAYYQLGIIYKDKFKEYKLAQDKLEDLLESNPEERLVLPAMYNLYKIYELLRSDKKQALKAAITSRYPDSRYTQILNNPEQSLTMQGTPDAVYKSAYKLFEEAQYRELLVELNLLIDQYSGEEIISKLELLKANTLGSLRGLDTYKDALNYVALTYPNSQEGKEAERRLSAHIPKMEKMTFGATASGWKLIYKAAHQENLTELNKKLDLYLKDHQEQNLKITLDLYTETENFVVIHNLKSEQQAKNMLALLTEYKDYKVKEKFVWISTEDYEVVQIKKNFDQYQQPANIVP